MTEDWRRQTWRISEELARHAVARAKDPRWYVAEFVCPEYGKDHLHSESL